MKNTLLLSAFAVACIPTGKDTADTSDDIVDTDTDITEPELGAAVEWGDDSVELTIENGSEEADYMWGIAETADSTDPWTGEDCYGGYVLNDDTVLSFCHPVADDGGMLAYGASPNDIVEGATTVFGSADFEARTTHILDDYATGGSCWVWGEDTSYYADYGKTCTEL